jgi:hypothetical protein
MPSHPDEGHVISGTFGDQIRSAMRPDRMRSFASPQDDRPARGWLQDERHTR